MKYIVNILFMHVKEYEHNSLQFSFNVIFVKSDRINKQSFKSQFFVLYLQRSNNLLFISNNTIVNNRLSKINDIFYVELKFLL